MPTGFFEEWLCRKGVGWRAAAEEMVALTNAWRFVSDNSYSRGRLSLQAQHRPW